MGFSWPAFFFCGLWAIAKGLTLPAVIGIVTVVIANRMPADADDVAIPITIALMLTFGVMGNKWRVIKLEKSGFKLVDTVSASSATDAVSMRTRELAIASEHTNQPNSKPCSSTAFHDATTSSLHDAQPDGGTAPQQQSNRQSMPQLRMKKEDDDEDLWARALAEFDSQERRPGLWARLFAEADGDENRAKASYLKKRVDQLKVETAKQTAPMDQEGPVRLSAREQSELEWRRHRYLAGEAPTKDEIDFLVDASVADKSIVAWKDCVRGDTLLHWCAKFDLQNLASRLLANGADPNARNGFGKRPIDVAKWQNTRELFARAQMAIEEPAMQRYGITRDGDKFRYRIWRYDSLADAIAYAKMDLGEK